MLAMLSHVLAIMSCSSITMNDRCLVGWMVTNGTIHMMEVSTAAIEMFSLFFFGGGGGKRQALLAQWRYHLPHPLWEEP